MMGGMLMLPRAGFRWESGWLAWCNQKAFVYSVTATQPGGSIGLQRPC